MNRMFNFAKRFTQDEEGASMVEYTVLIGIITVGVVASVTLIGGWVGTQWTGLVTAIGAGG
ncbi:MAG: Flp family type IVb pilin [Pseudomonadota bacterium]